jgi:hypothetical protein
MGATDMVTTGGVGTTDQTLFEGFCRCSLFFDGFIRCLSGEMVSFFKYIILALLYLLAQDAPSPIPGLRLLGLRFLVTRCGKDDFNPFCENQVKVARYLCLCRLSLLNFRNMSITQILQKVSVLFDI